MYGSSETTFYVLAVYFGAVGVSRTRHAVPAALVGDIVAALAAFAAKAAVHAWAKGLSREVGKYGITVNSAQPDASSQEEINAANQQKVMHLLRDDVRRLGSMVGDMLAEEVSPANVTITSSSRNFSAS